MAKDKVIGIEELIQDDRNFNRGTEKGKELIEKSFRELGAGRSVLIDKDNRLIGGNKAQIGAMDAGITKVRIIETDGTELIAVKRTDISLDTEKGRKMALADNATQQANLSWDKEELKKAQEDFGIVPEDWGLSDDSQLDMNGFFNEEQQGKSGKVEAITINVILPTDYTEDDASRIREQIHDALSEYSGIQIQ